MWKWASRVAITAAVLVIALRIADWAAHHAGPLPAVPQPNGYETLLAVGREVKAPEGDLADLSPDAIRGIADTNRRGLGRLREALRAETGVPLKTERGWGDRHAEDLKQLKRLAVVLGIQSKAELLNGNTNESARFMLDTIALGQALARGGILSDGGNALIVETIGTGSLRMLAPVLDAPFCRAAARELEQFEARREEPERILNAQGNWSAASYGLVSRLGDLFLRKANAHRRVEFTRRYRETTRRTRRLMVLLAGRAVELETASRVVHPADLVPSVLRSVPLDPDNNAPMAEVPGAKSE